MVMGQPERVEPAPHAADPLAATAVRTAIRVAVVAGRTVEE